MRSSLPAGFLNQTEQPRQPRSPGVTGTTHQGHSFLRNEPQLRPESTAYYGLSGETEAQALRTPAPLGQGLEGKQLIREPGAAESGSKERERERRGPAGGRAVPLRSVFLLMAISAFSRQTKARAWLMSLRVKLFKQTLHIKTEWLIAKPETRA